MIIQYRIEKWPHPYAPNPASLRLNLTREGYRVFQWVDRPEIAYGMHSHGTDQSHWIVSGSLEITVETVGTFVLNAGDRDFMPKGALHSARVLGDEPVMYLVGEK